MAMSMRRSRLTTFFKQAKCRHLLVRLNQTSSLQAFEEPNNEVEYPAVKPKLPPGKWGDMDTKLAWLWHEEGEKWKELPTIQERLDRLAVKDSEFGRKLWKYRSMQARVGLSEYQQDKTKTALIQGEPDIVKDTNIDIDNEFREVKNILIDKLAEEDEILSNDQQFRNNFLKYKIEKQNTKLIQSLVMEIVTVLSQKHEHLLNGQMDNDVDIAAYWDRYGVQSFKPKPDKEKKFPLPPRFLQNYAPFQSKSHISCQLRSTNPLPEFLPRNDTVCTSQPYPECRYWPAIMGTANDWVKPKCDPGFIPQDPFQFVNLSFVPRNKQENMILLKNYGEDHTKELLRCFGMNTAFISTVAQAYYQGFSTYVDITYPFTTQTVMTDGRLFSIYSYQLNTLHLWKDDKENPLRNICYIQDSLPMYDTIENGQVKGFNDDTFKALMKCFVLKPVNRGYEMKPTISSDSSDLKQPDRYISDPIEEIIIEEKIEYDQS